MEPCDDSTPCSASGYLDDAKDMAWEALVDAICLKGGDGQPDKRRRRSLSTSGIACIEVSKEEKEKASRDNLSIFSSLSRSTSECGATTTSAGTDNAPSRQRISQVCIHGRVKGTCKVCGGTRICIHGRQKAQCRDCKKAGIPGAGSQICEHDKRRSVCKICRGSQICEHDKRRSFCKICRGSQIYAHGNRKGVWCQKPENPSSELCIEVQSVEADVQKKTPHQI